MTGDSRGLRCALQLTLNYWLYPYIVWFLPLALVALVATHPERELPVPEPADAAADGEQQPIRIHIASS
jgi:hypothetical protein